MKPFILLFCILLFVPCFVSADAYLITPSVAHLTDGWRYTWNVYNVDQGAAGYYVGLDGFAILAPSETKITDFTIPPAGIGGYGAWWTFDELTTELRHAGDNQLIISAPPEGFKWLVFWGNGWDSVYPTGRTAIFSFTTDLGTIPGTVSSEQVTFLANVPRVNPEYYLTYFSDTTGPTGIPQSSVPEPTTILLLGIGIVGFITVKLRRHQ
jgi:hypothetical protein